LTDKAVDKGAFPRLELAEDGHVDGLVLNHQAFSGFQLTLQGKKLEARADLPQILEKALNGMDMQGKVIGNFVHKKLLPVIPRQELDWANKPASFQHSCRGMNFCIPTGVISPEAGGSDLVNSITMRDFYPRGEDFVKPYFWPQSQDSHPYLSLLEEGNLKEVEVEGCEEEEGYEEGGQRMGQKGPHKAFFLF